MKRLVFHQSLFATTVPLYERMLLSVQLRQFSRNVRMPISKDKRGIKIDRTDKRPLNFATLEQETSSAYAKSAQKEPASQQSNEDRRQIKL